MPLHQLYPLQQVLLQLLQLLLVLQLLVLVLLLPQELHQVDLPAPVPVLCSGQAAPRLAAVANQAAWPPAASGPWLNWNKFKIIIKSANNILSLV